MTAEQLQDALNQLPDDLISATDTLRVNSQPRPLVWKRLLPIAACFLLVLGALYVTLPALSRKSAPSDSASQNAYSVLDEAKPEMEMAGAVETATPGEAAGEPEAPAEMAPEAEGTGRCEESGAPLAPDMEENADATASDETAVTCHSYCIGSMEPDETRITVISTAAEWDRYLMTNPRLTEEGGFENRYEAAYFENNQLIVVVTTAASSSVRYELDTIRKTGTGTWELTGTRHTPEWFTDDMTQQCILVELPRMVEPEDTVTLNLEAVFG